MIPPHFEYASPRSLSEAITLLSRGGEGAKVLAGGQSLMPLLKLRLASPSLLVDINRIPGLDGIKEDEGFLRIGALTRMAEVETSDLIRKGYPIIHDAAEVIGDPLVRNLGTIGGNVSHGDPNNDMPAVMLALGAQFVATGPSGERSIKAEQFFTDSFTVALDHDEILTEIWVPKRSSRSGGCYLKLEQKVADFATAAVAVQVRLGEAWKCEEVGLGLTAVGPTAIKARKAEQLMRGKKTTDKNAIQGFGRLAADESSPATDIRGTASYKKQVVRLLVIRAFRKACERARGG
ncbi:MAG TPA: xanthine dehydrogenase family protein subunit M [Nitrososphaerales archaeon]|nr:xanthine dehydrogenase family protein subunit M [Nitrososphaerales archaeon]